MIIAGKLPDGFGGLRKLFKRACHVGEQLASSICQADLTMATLEQKNTKRAFELLDRHTDRWLLNVQFLRRTCERSSPCCGLEKDEVAR